MKHYSSRSPGCCSCATLRRKWPHLLLTCSLIGLVLFGLLKWVALDWLVEHQIAQVKTFWHPLAFWREMSWIIHTKFVCGSLFNQGVIFVICSSVIVTSKLSLHCIYCNTEMFYVNILRRTHISRYTCIHDGNVILSCEFSSSFYYGC